MAGTAAAVATAGMAVAVATAGMVAVAATVAAGEATTTGTAATRRHGAWGVRKGQPLS